MYDVCIVGAGTLGSAAARHLAETHRDKRLLLIGPSEKQGINIHGAYYDEGRITRSVDPDPVWLEISQQSMKRYSQDHKNAGDVFFHEVGWVGVGSSHGDYVESLVQNAAAQHSPCLRLAGPALRTRFPYFNFLSDEHGVYFSSGAGYVNPRIMVAKQLKLAKQFGADIKDDIVSSITEDAGGFTLNTDDGQVFQAQRVLLTTGAFTSCRALLPAPLRPDIELQAECVLLIEVPSHKLQQYTGMPCMLIYRTGKENNGAGKQSLQAYILPPIQYPDGKFYLKIGHGKYRPVPINTAEDIHQWYTHTGMRSQEQELSVEQYLLNLAQQYFPSLDLSCHQFAYCVTAHTPSGYPYIDMLTQGLGVCLAGNGRAAKAADEIGRMAARMIIGDTWGSKVKPEHFHFQAAKIQAKL